MEQYLTGCQWGADGKFIAPVKRGDSLQIVGVYYVGGQPVDLTDINIRAQVRSSTGELVQELAVIKGSETGSFVLDAGIINWPVDVLQCDIQFADAGTVHSTETFLIPVKRDVTHG